MNHEKDMHERWKNREVASLEARVMSHDPAILEGLRRQLMMVDYDLQRMPMSPTQEWLDLAYKKLSILNQIAAINRRSPQGK